MANYSGICFSSYLKGVTHEGKFFRLFWELTKRKDKICIKIINTNTKHGKKIEYLSKEFNGGDLIEL